MNGCVQTVTANIPLANYSGFFRVSLMSSTDGWLPQVLIVARGEINPLDHCAEVYEKLGVFLKVYGLELDKCQVYLDLMEYLGIREPFLFKWELKKNGCLKSQVETVNFSDLPLDALNLIKNYYSDKWSLFKESLLTNEEKVAVLGDILSTSVYDEADAENTSLSIKFRILEAMRLRSSLDSIFEKVIKFE